jgi:hypothetical protein
VVSYAGNAIQIKYVLGNKDKISRNNDHFSNFSFLEMMFKLNRARHQGYTDLLQTPKEDFS